MLPKNKNNFVKSFLPNDIENIIKFLDEYGVVVIDNILDQNEINNSINAIWNHDELTSRGVLHQEEFYIKIKQHGKDVGHVMVK